MNATFQCVPYLLTELHKFGIGLFLSFGKHGRGETQHHVYYEEFWNQPIVAADPFFVSRRNKLVELAVRQTLPAIYPMRDFVAAGGLMSYGASLADGYRQVSIYAGRILEGAPPADLPVQQAVKVELVINLKTAKALSLDVILQQRADEVIE